MQIGLSERPPPEQAEAVDLPAGFLVIPQHAAAPAAAAASAEQCIQAGAPKAMRPASYRLPLFDALAAVALALGLVTVMAKMLKPFEKHSPMKAVEDLREEQAVSGVLSFVLAAVTNRMLHLTAS
ncbi:hypothetical protein Esti_004428 [Eimeria stiedai]